MSESNTVIVRKENQSLVLEPDSRTPLLSTEVYDTLVEVFGLAIFLFCLLGMVTNSINIRVFLRQGITSDSTTLGLFALAISDFLGCFTLLPTSGCLMLFYANMYFQYYSCTVILSSSLSIMHVVFARITCWITVYISVEKALCVIWPFKVKQLFRPTTCLKVVISIYIFFIVYQIPYFVFNNVVYVFDSRINTTKPVPYSTDIGTRVSIISSVVINIAGTTLAMIIVFIATVMMIHNLNASSKWRESLKVSTVTSQINDNAETASDPKRSVEKQRGPGKHEPDKTTRSSNASKRDKELVKTVTAVTGVYLVSLSGSHIPALASLFLPEVSSAGLNSNVYLIVNISRFFFDVVNSSVNLFFYVHTSSRFRQTFRTLFQKGTT